MPARYRDDLADLLEQRLGADPELEPGKMMGHPGYRIVTNNKFFVFAGEDGLVLKLPPDRYEEAMARDDTEAFNPMKAKKPMSTWVEWVRADVSEYERDWSWFVDSAREFTAAEPPNPKKKRG